jgi:hypothetical protein
MKTVDELLDGVKSRRSIPSDYKLAAYLGVVPGAVKHWRHGRSLPDARVAARIAAELEMDPDVLVAELEAQRAQTAETRELWHRIATRLQGGTVHGVVLAGLVALGFITTPPNAVAAVTDLQSANSRGSVYYVKCRICHHGSKPAWATVPLLPAHARWKHQPVATGWHLPQTYNRLLSHTGANRTTYGPSS